MSGVGATDVSTMAVSLLVVVGLIVAAGYVLRRTPLGVVARQSGPLKVVATLPLGARERLVLVDARGSELLLAISPAGVFNVSALRGAQPAAGATAAASDAAADVRPPARGSGAEGTRTAGGSGAEGTPAGREEPAAPLHASAARGAAGEAERRG